jgi:hypothetical protein
MTEGGDTYGRGDSYVKIEHMVHVYSGHIEGWRAEVPILDGEKKAAAIGHDREEALVNLIAWLAHEAAAFTADLEPEPEPLPFELPFDQSKTHKFDFFTTGISTNTSGVLSYNDLRALMRTMGDPS